MRNIQTINRDLSYVAGLWIVARKDGRKENEAHYLAICEALEAELKNALHPRD